MFRVVRANKKMKIDCTALAGGTFQAQLDVRKDEFNGR